MKRAAWTRRAAPWIVGFAVTCQLAAMAMLVRGHDQGIPPYGYWREAIVNGLVYAGLAFLLASKGPDNPISWIVVALAMVGALQLLTGEYAFFASDGGEHVTFSVRFAGWFSDVCQSLFVTLVLLLLLLFPTGRPATPRWRVLGWGIVTGALVGLLLQTIEPGTVAGLRGVERPFALDRRPRLLDAVAFGALALWGGAALGVIASLIVRFRRSDGVERAQLKWLVYAATIGIAVLMAPLPLSEDAGALLWALVPASISGSIGIAVLKYRLYDVDVLINRTLVYGALTAILAATYVGLVTAA
ncbi:MAG: hypothetical protein M3345_01710, partial [Actinomycetota bacterium]|nr:hypothetical protein [Actinomycetota bacterium]